MVELRCAALVICILLSAGGIACDGRTSSQPSPVPLKNYFDPNAPVEYHYSGTDSAQSVITFEPGQEKHTALMTILRSTTILPLTGNTPEYIDFEKDKSIGGVGPDTQPHYTIFLLVQPDKKLKFVIPATPYAGIFVDGQTVAHGPLSYDLYNTLMLALPIDRLEKYRTRTQIRWEE